MQVAVHVIAVFFLLLTAPVAAFSQVLATPRPGVPPIVSTIPPLPAPPAQTPAAAEAEDEQEPPPDLWSFAAEFSYTDQTGNKTLRLLTGGLKFAHRDKKSFELDGSLQSRYGQSEGEVVSRNYFGNLNFSPFKQARVSPSFSVKAERDPFKRLDLRFVGSAGAKVTPYRTDRGDGEVSLFLMTSYEFQNLQATPEDDSDEFTHVPRWTMEMRGSQKLNSSVTAHLQSSYEPSWGELANYLLRSQTGMKVLLTERLALSVEYQFNRTNEPPEGVAPDDRLFKTGVIIDF
jgi:hypothetical protein